MKMRILSEKNKKQIIEVVILIVVASLFRLPSFFLSHNNNDELIHLSLAMKIDAHGFDVFKRRQYNLFFVEKGFLVNGQMVSMFEGEHAIASFLNGLLGERETLSHHPPLLPIALFLSHKFFADTFDYMVNVSSNIYLMLNNFFFQFYATVAPFLFSIALIISVYALGRLMFSHKIALLAAFFLSFTPAELVASNKVWADDMTAFFFVLSVILFLYSFKKSKPILALLAGLSCGLAIITKMSGTYLIFIVLLFHIWEQRDKPITIRNACNFLFDRKILYFLAGVIVVSARWIDLYYSSFSLGTVKEYFAINEPWEQARTWNQYFSVVSNRPWFAYFVLVPYQFPVYLFSYIFIVYYSFRKFFKIKNDFSVSDNFYLQFMVLWIAVVFLFLTFKPGKELRYMLIAYPAVAMLSAYALECCNNFLKNPGSGVSDRLRRFFLLSTVSFSLFFALKIALPRILYRSDVIPIPF